MRLPTRRPRTAARPASARTRPRPDGRFASPAPLLLLPAQAPLPTEHPLALASIVLLVMLLVAALLAIRMLRARAAGLHEELRRQSDQRGKAEVDHRCQRARQALLVSGKALISKRHDLLGGKPAPRPPLMVAGQART